MKESVFYNSIIPLFVVRNTAVILLSTIQGGNNLFTRMMRLTLDNGQKLFDAIKLVYICDECRSQSDFEKGDIRACPHMKCFLPAHHSKQQMEQLRIFNKGREASMAQETLNLDIGMTNRVFSKRFVEQFTAAPDYHLSTEIDYVYIGYDPHPGGKESLVGLHAAVEDAGLHVILSQNTFHSHTPLDQVDAVYAMIRSIKNKQQFANAVIVVACENNTIAHAKLVEEALYHTHRDLISSVCILYETKSDPTRPGITTTQEINQCYQLQSKLSTNRLRYWSGYFTTNSAQGPAKMREMFVSQLDNYQYVEASNVSNRDVMIKTAKVVTTGKIGNNFDDLVDACELCMIGRLRFGGNAKKYAKYIK